MPSILLLSTYQADIMTSASLLALLDHEMRSPTPSIKPPLKRSSNSSWLLHQAILHAPMLLPCLLAGCRRATGAGTRVTPTTNCFPKFSAWSTCSRNPSHD